MKGFTFFKNNKKITLTDQPNTNEVNQNQVLSLLQQINATSKRLPKVLLKEQVQNKYRQDFTPDGHAIDAFMQENRHAENLLREIRRKLKKVERIGLDVHWKDLLLLLNELKEIKIHFKRKEELLFPKLKEEKLNLLTENFTTLHNKINVNISNMITAAEAKNYRNVKQLFSQTDKMIIEGITKEEQVLFPSALSQLSDLHWKEIRSAGRNIGYCWINQSQDQLTQHLEQSSIRLDGFRLDTGFMTIAMIDSLFKSLPIEITVVNQKDIIVYYNNKSERIFKRSSNFIGERFEDCHSGKTEKTVKKIISNFKKEKCDNIELYFNIDNKKIYVQYKPIYDASDNYAGFIETAIDITYFRNLEGEKIDPFS